MHKGLDLAFRLNKALRTYEVRTFGAAAILKQYGLTAADWGSDWWILGAKNGN